jgi:hypothetical protein
MNELTLEQQEIARKEEAFIRQKFSNQCVHWTGFARGTTCKAGIAYADVKLQVMNLAKASIQYALTGEVQKPVCYPCLKSDNCTERCAQATFRSETEVEQEVQEYMQQFEEELRTSRFWND